MRVIEPVKNLMGFASVKFNDCFVVENLKIVQGSKGLFLGMPDVYKRQRKATPGTEESKEPPKKQPIKEVLQDKADEKKAQRTAPAQAKHRQQDMEL